MMKSHHRVLKNFLSLSAAEAVRKGLAFFTFAILARVLNPAGFGDFNWAMTFVMYFLLFVDMGFNLIGIREVARDHSIIKKYVNHIITIRSLISIVCFLLMVLIAFLIDKPIEVKIMVVVSGINLFANALLLDWVFQGIEKMEIIAVRQIIVGALNLLGVVIFVNSPDDKIAAMLVFMLSLLINSIWLLGYYIKSYGMVKFSYDKELWKKIFDAAIPMGVSNLFIMIITGTSIMLLGFMSTSDETGYFAAAHKIFMISLLPLTIIQGTMFPIISRAKTLEERQQLLSKYTTILYFVGAMICFSIMAYSDQVISIIYGPKYDAAPVILQILMINSLLIHFNNSYSAPMIAWNFEKEILKVTIVGAVINVSMNLYLIPIYGAYGSAWANFAGELSITSYLSFIAVKRLKKIFLYNYIRFILICGLGLFAGWLMHIHLDIHFIITIIMSFIVILLAVFAGGVIRIKDLKNYLFKND
jgi:O-antigen/teichoic acid export membrane protein